MGVAKVELKNLSNKKSNLHGFSLLEAIIAVVILGFASFAAVTLFSNQLKASRNINDLGKVAEIKQALTISTSDSTLCNLAMVPVGAFQDVGGPIVVNAPPYNIHVGASIDGAWQVLSSSFLPVPGPLSTDAPTTLQVGLRKTNSDANMGSTDQLLTIPLLVSTDGASKLTDCSGPSSGTTAQSLCVALGWTWNHMPAPGRCTPLVGVSACTALGAGWSWNGTNCVPNSSVFCTTQGMGAGWSVVGGMCRPPSQAPAICSSFGGTWSGGHCTFAGGGGGGGPPGCLDGGVLVPPGSTRFLGACITCVSASGCPGPLGCGNLSNGQQTRYRQTCVGPGGNHSWVSGCGPCT